jgi:hypothetical protein
MPPKQKPKQKTKQKQKQKQKQTQSVVVNIGKTNVTRASRSGRKRLPPVQSYPPLPIIIQGQQQQPDYSSILTAMMMHQTRQLSQKEPIINNLTPTPVQEPQTPQIQPSSNQQLTQQERRELSSAAAERRSGNTASNFQAQPSSLAPSPSSSPLAPATIATPLQPTVATPIREGDNYFRDTLVQPTKVDPNLNFQEQNSESRTQVRRTQAQLNVLDPGVKESQARDKALEASKKQSEEKTNFMKSINDKLDKGESLSQSQVSRLMSIKTLSKKLKEKLISNGYDLFTSTFVK